MKQKRVILKTAFMFRILVFIFSLTLFASCHKHEVRNKYLEQKNHPSDKLNKESVKATKKAKKDLVKGQKRNDKAIKKSGNHFWNKKKQYT